MERDTEIRDLKDLLSQQSQGQKVDQNESQSLKKQIKSQKIDQNESQSLKKQIKSLEELLESERNARVSENEKSAAIQRKLSAEIEQPFKFDFCTTPPAISDEKVDADHEKDVKALQQKLSEVTERLI